MSDYTGRHMHLLKLSVCELLPPPSSLSRLLLFDTPLYSASEHHWTGAGSVLL